MASQEQIDSFHRFASEDLNNDSSADIDELYSRWRMENPTPTERDEVNAIIRQGIDDIATGRGRDAEEVSEELRKKHNLPAE